MIVRDYNVFKSVGGGYWRYPKLLNFCYPCNPFFPPQRMINEIKANMEKLISEYPSGMRVNALLAAKNLGIDASMVVVSNGIEEIIRSIISITGGKVGCVIPTNEELVNRCGAERMESYVPLNRDLSYTADDIIEYYSNRKLGIFVLINPEYHTGNYIDKNSVIRILDWGNLNNIKIVVDESYCDFSDERDNSLIDEKILLKYHNVIVLKNISVTHGVSGLRLGCAVSSNREWIEEIERDLSIWNINSLAEFYLQIEEKYHKDYDISLEQFREVKEKFIKELSEISGIRPIPSQANYCLCELESSFTSKKLTEQVLIKYGILVKDMTDRINNGRQYIKIAIRNDDDNQKLIIALRMCLKESRIVGSAVRINDERTKKFFETRTQKNLPHRYNYVIYQDSNPELALERDAYEKEKIGPYLNVNSQSMVLDIGCGVGRWGDEIVPQLTHGKYIGIDFSEEFIKIAKKNLGNDSRCKFYQGSFQETESILKAAGHTTFDTVLINGILMYINDSDIHNCLAIIDRFTHVGSIIYIKESVGIGKRFTLKDFYSEELGSQYNAIYRSLDEYNNLFENIYLKHGYRIVKNEATWKHEQENRKETLSWYWIIKKCTQN